MKTTVIAATIAFGLTAGAALADQPMVLTDALDRVTGGATMREFVILIGLDHNTVAVDFTAAEQAGQNGRISPGVNEIIVPGGFVDVRR